MLRDGETGPDSVRCAAVLGELVDLTLLVQTALDTLSAASALEDVGDLGTAGAWRRARR